LPVPISALLSAYRNGTKTATAEITERLVTITKREPELGAFLTVRKEQALNEGKNIDAAQDFSKPLAGIPGAIKDIICTAGERTTAASKILENFVPPYDATVVKKLKAAGYISLGRT